MTGESDPADVLAFLRARCDADEQAAPEVHAASCPAIVSSGMLYAVDSDSCTCGWPPRLLAEVASARAILDLHQPVVDTSWPHPGHCTECWDQTIEDYRLWPCRTVRLIVQSYAGREGWWEEWRA